MKRQCLSALLALLLVITLLPGAARAGETPLQAAQSGLFDGGATGTGEAVADVHTVEPQESEAQPEQQDCGLYTQQECNEAYRVGDKINYLVCKTVYLMCEDGFTDEKAKSFQVKVEDGELTSASMALCLRAGKEGEEARYDVAITLPQLETIDNNYTLEVFQEEQCVAACRIAAEAQSFRVDDDTIIGNVQVEPGLVEVNDEERGETPTWGKEEYCYFYGFNILPVKEQTDEAYVLDLTVQVEVTSVEVIPLNEKFDASSAFQWKENPGEYGGDRWDFTCAGVAFEGALRFTVKATPQGGAPVEGAVIVPVFLRPVGETVIDRTGLAGDTVADLNNCLKELADKRENASYIVKLAPIEYKGTIVIPSGFDSLTRNLTLRGTAAQNGGRTTLHGGITMEEDTRLFELRDIAFIGSETADKALYGGNFNNVHHCTFTGYQTAMLADSAMITFSDCLFYKNEIALLVKLADVGGNQSILRNNLFIENGTAVRAERFQQENMTAFYFRIVDSNFIGNACDVDMQTGGTVYLYRNYYADTRDTGALAEAVKAFDCSSGGDLAIDASMIAYSRPKIRLSEESGGAVITNPRWLYPVFGNSLWEEKANLLVADWSGDTRILNAEADELALDAAAFEGSGEKTVEVLDEQEQTLGAWTFD